MANTIKFGDGQWATKEDSILAYNDENANFKPLPFITSRASTATRVNKAGLLETVSSGVPRVDYLDNSKGSYLLEPSSTNLITQSESFGNTYWTKSGATIQGDASTAGVEKVVNGDFTGGTTGWTLGTGYTISGGVLNLTNVNSSTTQNSVWEIGKMYLVTVDYNFVSGTRLILPYDGTTQASIITSASSGTSSYYYTPSATTMYIYSDGNGNGTIDNVSVKEVQGFASPSVDSPLGAFKLVEGTNNGVHRVGRATFSANTERTLSVIVKKGERDYISFFENNFPSGITGVIFNLDNGTYFNSDTSFYSNVKIKLISNGWYRCSVTFQNGGLSVPSFAVSADGLTNSYQGDGTSGIYIFGAQLEQKSYATSYIPTKGSQISRLSESASLLNLDTNNLVNDNGAWTVFFELELLSNNNAYDKIALTDATNTPRVYLYHSSAGVAGSSWTGGTSIPMNTNNKIIYRANSDKNISFFNNGANLVTMISSDVPIVFNRIILNGANGVFRIKQMQVFNSTLSDSECVTLTTI